MQTPSPLSRMRSTAQSPANSGGTLKSLLQRHQGLVSVLQYLTRAGVMFMPGSMELYEVAVEGCYSTSQLISFLNSTILEDTWQRSSGLEDCMVLVTRAITHIEVLAEKLALALGGEFRRSQMAWLIELLKAVCRLVMLADRGKPTLLLHWGLFSDPGEIKLDLKHYVRWYTRPERIDALQSLLRPSPATITEEKEEPLELQPLAPSQVIQTQTLIKHARSFQGKRSGLVLNVPAMLGAAPGTPTAAAAPVASPTAGTTCDSGARGRSSGEAGYIECLTTYIGLPSQTEQDDEKEGEVAEERAQQKKDEAGTRDCASKPAAPMSLPPALVASVPEPASAPVPEVLQVTAAAPKLDAKYLIYLGEVLYALRPAIYAWALHRVNRMHGAAAEASATAAAASSTASSGLGGAYADVDLDSDDHSRWVPSGNRTPRGQRQQVSTWGNLKRRVQANLWPSNVVASISRMRSGYAASPPPAGGGYGREIDVALATAVAMMVEVTSVHLTRMGLKLAREEAARNGAPAQEGDASTTNLHAFDKELQRRQLALLYYFLRSPLFDKTTLPLLEMAARLVSRIPLLGGLPASAIGLVRYLNRTHFYTSASS